MAKVKKQKVLRVSVLVRKMKLKLKKVTVNVMSMRLGVQQIRDLSSQWQTMSTLGKSTVCPTREQSALGASRLGLSVDFVSDDCVADIQDCLGRGEVTRLSRCVQWKWPFNSSENYGLGSQKSMEADNEDSPRKKVPVWARERQIRRAITAQVDVDTDLVFAPCDPPDLSLMFPTSASKRRDLWNSPTRSEAMCDTPPPGISLLGRPCPAPPASQVSSWEEEEDEEISFPLIARDKADSQQRRGECQEQSVVNNCTKVLFKLDCQPSQPAQQM
eukprot:GFUD01034997.1.p1 GENE.GFUD01034997.1~~GFUD01034997.1.p1  ORF type:complete len:273 (-),score=77.88 GFUD01034997.1:212-1030(-)